MARSGAQGSVSPGPGRPRPRRSRQRATLPGSAPKPGAEDRAAPALVRQLLDSPSYVQADEDVIAPEDADLFSFAETATEIWKHIQDWYRADPGRIRARTEAP